MSRRKRKGDELAEKPEDSLAEAERAPLTVKEAPAAADLETQIDDLKRQVAEKSELAQAYFAQLQRVQADFENYQKRVEAERTRIAEGACENIISGLLDTLDNFDRAMAHLEKLPEEDAKGVMMVYGMMLDYLRGNGLERIAAAGCQFDPRKHDAIMQAEIDDAKDGTVLEEFQAGYAVKGKVIRPSKVKVARERKKELDKNENDNIEKEE